MRGDPTKDDMVGLMGESPRYIYTASTMVELINGLIGIYTENNDIKLCSSDGGEVEVYITTDIGTGAKYVTTEGMS